MSNSVIIPIQVYKLVFLYIMNMTSLGPTPEIKRCEHCLQGTIIVPLHFFFEREFQLMASAPDDSSLSSDQDINQFLV